MGQQPGQNYVGRLFDHIRRGELDPSYLSTHRLPLDDGPRGYAVFKHKEDGCLRVVFAP
jgi:threonine dehydrogenase-like Zn-dependent dehydrogenase